MMHKIHGSIAKLGNDKLPERRVPFFRSANHHDYFDGCLRDVLQAERTYRYVQIQSVRHGIVKDYREYPHTRMSIETDRGVRRAVQLNAFLEGLPNARYERRNARNARGGVA